MDVIIYSNPEDCSNECGYEFWSKETKGMVNCKESAAGKFKNVFLCSKHLHYTAGCSGIHKKEFITNKFKTKKDKNK